MSCALHPQAEAYAFGRLAEPERAAFAAHLPTCPGGCAKTLADVAPVAKTLAHYAPYEPNELEWARLDRNVLAALDKAPAKRPLGWLFPATGLAALAAAVALVLAVRAPKPPDVLPSPPLPTVEAVVVAAGEGGVRVDASQKAEPARPALRVHDGDRLESAAATLALQTAPATGLFLMPGAKVKVEHVGPSVAEFALLEGQALAEVKPLGKDGRFQIAVGDLLVSVRGTAFSVNRLPGLVRVEVLHGLVEVRRVSTGHAVLVPGPGFLEVPDGAAYSTAELKTTLSPETAAALPVRFEDDALESLLTRGKPVPIATEPAGASVRLDGALVGRSPLTLLSTRPATLAVELPGRKAVEVRVDPAVAPALVAPASVPLLLEPEPEAVPEVKPAEPSPEKPKGLQRRPAVKPLEEPEVVARREAMSFQVRTHQKELVDCYERAMKRSPALGGRVNLLITVGPTGSVSDIATADGQPADPWFLQCASESIRGWQLPGTGEDETFELPLNLFRRE